MVIKEGKYINLKPNSLFSRLTALAQREDDVEKFVEYEITTIPMSLFKHWIIKLLCLLCEMEETSKQVFDGNKSLMYKVRLEKNVTF